MSGIISIQRHVEDCFAQGRFSEAEEGARGILEKNPDQGRIWLLCGLARHRLKDFGLARAALEHASLLVPLDADAQCALAECYAQTEMPAHAGNLYRHLLDDANTPIEVLPKIAAGFGKLGDNDAALEACRAAADLQPDRAEPLFGVAFYLRRLGFPPAAMIPVLAQAFELSRGALFYRCTLAFMLAEDGRRDEAYDLLCQIEPEEVGCPCQLRRIMSVFQATGDYRRWSVCRGRLDSIRRQRRGE